MKVHRLLLRNYRGIAHRDIEFPEHGVVVVSGANEVGKSSMIEALDLLLEAKDRSGKKEVKQVKPTHADEGAEVTAEISTGPYRFEYHKRFHKRPQTRLTVTSPRREQLTGDEAHERVQAILAETVDTDLWQAQRVLQASSTSPVDLSGCDALSRALDVAAGQAAALAGGLTGSEPLLIDRIDTEFRRYFTATGRPAGAWAAALTRLKETQAAVTVGEAALAEVDDAVLRHGRLIDDLAEAARQCAEATTRLEAARGAVQAVEHLTARLAAERASAQAAQKACAASAAALAERRRLSAEIEQRTAAIAALEPEVQRTAVQEASAREAAAAAEAAAGKARCALDGSQARLDAARDTADRIAARDEAHQLRARLRKIDTQSAELPDVLADLARITLSDMSMRAIETAAVAVERAAAKAELASAQVEFEAIDTLQIVVSGEAVALEAGRPWTQSVTTPTHVEVPGLLRVRVVPGTPAADSQATAEAARQELTAHLTAASVPDLDAARALDTTRRRLIAQRDRLRATIDALVGDDDIDALRVRLAGLDDTTGDEPAGGPGHAEEARAAVSDAETAYKQSRAACEVQREAATQSTEAVLTAAGAATSAREKLAAARTELTQGAERLSRQRDSMPDDQVSLAAQQDAERARELTARVREVETELAAAAPDAVAAEFDAAAGSLRQLSAHHAELGGQLREVTAQLRVYGSEGRQGRLDTALADHEDAVAEHARVQRLAGAAQLLRSVMMRHRDDARRRYVEPFRAEVQRLGRIVFGDTFEVEIDSELRICSRTLAGRTVPYESLSGGAKEQLGIVARLAGAALVAKEDTVPVVIDDALGFSDAERLTKMGAVFDVVGGDGQVIVLTCSPQRFAGISGAHHIALTS